jgi:uncharacterized OB-fold protein
MTEPVKNVVDDAITAPFWEAATRRELVIQKCESCGKYQFYPRPFCLQCESDNIRWVKATGTGTIYSATVVRIDISAEMQPPYMVAIVEFDEGPRMLSTIRGNDGRIGDRVQIDWRERPGGPPIPEFRAVRNSGASES